MAGSPLKFCFREYLVGMGYPLVGNLSLSSDEINSGNFRGCSNLHCRQCKSLVKWHDHHRWLYPMTLLFPRTPTEEEALKIKLANDNIPLAYENPTSFIESSDTARAYGCRCHNLTVRNYEDLSNMDLIYIPWQCQGH